MAGPPTSSVLPPDARVRGDSSLGDLADGDALGLFGRDVAVHELERLPLGRALVGKDPHAGVPDDELIARRDVAHGQAAGRAAGRIDGDAAVHFLIGHVDPVAAQRGLRSAGWSCCKIPRERRRRCRPATSVQSCCVGRHGSVVGDLSQNLVQFARVGGPDLDQRRSSDRSAAWPIAICLIRNCRRRP